MLAAPHESPLCPGLLSQPPHAEVSLRLSREPAGSYAASVAAVRVSPSAHASPLSPPKEPLPALRPAAALLPVAAHPLGRVRAWEARSELMALATHHALCHVMPFPSR